MDEKLREIIHKWHIKAENDLITIENEFNSDNVITDTVCFHAQQAVEKYLKSFLIAHQKGFRHTHNITELLNQCIDIDASFRKIDFAVSLTIYAVEIRYPDDFFIPEIDEAREAYSVAKKVKEFILGRFRHDFNFS